jgi:hypothetical protein
LALGHVSLLFVGVLPLRPAAGKKLIAAAARRHHDCCVVTGEGEGDGFEVPEDGFEAPEDGLEVSDDGFEVPDDGLEVPAPESDDEESPLSPPFAELGVDDVVAVGFAFAAPAPRAGS